jgi:hypothetical protein
MIGMACSSVAPMQEEVGQGQVGEDRSNASEAVVEGPSDESCDALQAWAQANKERLPTSYEGFAQYSLAQRRAIYDLRSVEQRSELWKTHLNRYLDSHQEMSPTQTEVVRKAIAAISPDLFAGDDGRARIDDLMKSAKAVLSEEQSHEIFGTLGPPEGMALRPLSTPATPPDCDCNTTEVYCAGFPCQKNRYHCIHSNVGCGGLWLLACDGVCLTD